MIGAAFPHEYERVKRFVSPPS